MQLQWRLFVSKNNIIDKAQPYYILCQIFRRNNVIDTCYCTNLDVLLCHDDELEGRRIAFIFYLVPEWTKEDGGEWRERERAFVNLQYAVFEQRKDCLIIICALVCRSTRSV